MHLLPALLERFLHLPGSAPADTGHVEPAGKDSDFVCLFRRLAEEHVADAEFTTSSAAACIRLSRMHLNRKLRMLTGQSTHQFIQAIRLEKARNALMMDSMPVSAVAHRVGFKSASHFAKSFRQRFGITPAAYRRRCLDAVQDGPAASSSDGSH